MLHIEGVYTNVYSETNENVDKSLSIYLLNEIRIYRLRRKLSLSRTQFRYYSVSGCVDRAQMHCFTREPIMLLRRALLLWTNLLSIIT
jgi:hypothetical protein